MPDDGWNDDGLEERRRLAYLMDNEMKKHEAASRRASLIWCGLMVINMVFAALIGYRSIQSHNTVLVYLMGAWFLVLSLMLVRGMRVRR